MLKRRNTIHPGQQLHTKPIHPLDRHRHHSPATPTSSTSSTNPFLSSSLDDLSTLVLKHSQHRFHQQEQPLSADFTNNSKTNPFLYDSRACNPFSSQDTTTPVDHHHQQQQQDYRYPFHEQHDDSYLNPPPPESQSNTTNNNQAKDLHKRRMSLDVFKAPFNLNRGRRATCAASDLKRMLTIKTSSALNKRQQKKAEDYIGGDSDVSELNHTHEDGGDADEILKTSRYLPDEQVVDYQREDDGGQQYQNVQKGHAAMEDVDGYQYQHQQGHHQYKDDVVEESYNPFVQHHNNRAEQGQEGMAIHPFDSSPEQGDVGQYHQPFQATSRPSDTDGKNPTSLMRRRYSVFSDWSIEDCPRLLAMQQRQQQQQREEQEQLDRQYQDMSRSQTLTRSKTDTSLCQSQCITQRRRHTSTAHTNHPPPVSASPTTPQPVAAAAAATQRPRRNTVILGKNLIRSATAAGPNHRRPNPETSSLKSTSRNAATTDAYTVSLQRRQQEQQQQLQHGHVHGQQQQWRQPAGRPESSHSYKHDFLKDTARWKPHPWTAASSSHSYSSACSSPSSPLHQSRFPHELDRENEEDDESSSGDNRDSDSEDDDGEVGGRDGGMKVVEGGWKKRDQGEAHLQEHSRRHSVHSSSRRQSLVQERGGRERQRQSMGASDHSYRSLPVTTPTTRRTKAEPLYHDMKAIQMRPYGHEDDEDDEGDDDGYSRFEQYPRSSQEEDSGLQDQGYADGTGDYYGCYDELTQWHNQQHHYDQRQYQHDVAAGGYYESPSSSATSFSGSTAPSSNKTRSQDSLSKKASLAKAKFYKYLNKPSSTSNSHQHHPLDSGSSDLEAASHHHNHHSYYEVEDDEQHDNSLHFGSGYSFTSSLRARVRLTKTKTVLRQVKRRLSEALSEATTKAASTLRNDLHLGKKGASLSQEQPLAEAYRQDYGDGYEQGQDQAHRQVHHRQECSLTQGQVQSRVHVDGQRHGRRQYIAQPVM